MPFKSQAAHLQHNLHTDTAIVFVFHCDAFKSSNRFYEGQLAG